jgi:hypothetical protein
MSDELRQLDTECARVLGWTWDEDSAYSPTGSKCARPLGRRYWWLEHYSSDDTAARLLEDEIERRGLQEVYCRVLAHQHRNVLLRDYTWALLRSTPEQKARAFLKAIEGSNAHA